MQFFVQLVGVSSSRRFLVGLRIVSGGMCIPRTLSVFSRQSFLLSNIVELSLAMIIIYQKSPTDISISLSMFWFSSLASSQELCNLGVQVVCAFPHCATLGDGLEILSGCGFARSELRSHSIVSLHPRTILLKYGSRFAWSVLLHRDRG